MRANSTKTGMKLGIIRNGTEVQLMLSLCAQARIGRLLFLRGCDDYLGKFASLAADHLGQCYGDLDGSKSGKPKVHSGRPPFGQTRARTLCREEGLRPR
jgi:hypothetical protein